VNPRSRWLVIGLAVLCLAGLTAGLAVAFGGGDGGNSSTGSGPGGVQPTSGQTSSPSPNATDGCTGDPSFDFGQTICITDTGVRPRVLVSIVGRTVTWRNTTSRPQSIRFVALKGRSGRIPPGGTWTYTPTLPLSIAYRSSSGEGLDQIQVLMQE
jgi:hypothetical protein